MLLQSDIHKNMKTYKDSNRREWKTEENRVILKNDFYFGVSVYIK